VPAVTLENSSVPSDGLHLGTGYDRPDQHSSLPANPYTREYRHLGPPGPQPAANTLKIVARNIGSVVIDVSRAQVTCDAKLDVSTDGPLSVTLLGCGGAPHLSS
jgi:hypothetical protein